MIANKLVTFARPFQSSMFMLAPVATFNFASRYQMNRLTADRNKITLPNPEELKLVLPFGPKGQQKEKKAVVHIHTTKRRALFKNQLTPIHDYLNFKTMTGNEILLNLENHEHFAITELLGGLHELSCRTPPKRVDWMTHPITVSAMAHLKERIGAMTAKQIAQVPIIMHRLKWTDKQLWQECARQVVRLLHKYNSRDMAYFLDIFDREFLD